MLVNLNPVSSVRFRGVEQNSVNDILNRPGAFSNSEAPLVAPQKKKSHKFLKTLGKLILTAGIVAGASVALHKFLPNVFKVTKTPDAKGVQKYVEYVTTPIAKFGKYILDKCSALFSKKTV